jgi:hypothetical protein
MGGVSLPLAKPHESMSVLARARPPVEISLLRHSLGELAQRRSCCAHCGRTPLVGERVYLYAAAAGERLLCELCRRLKREPPQRSELVHSAENKGAVRVRRL